MVICALCGFKDSSILLASLCKFPYTFIYLDIKATTIFSLHPDGGNTKDFLIHTAFFFRDLTSAPLFLKKQTAVKCSVVSRTSGEKTWLGYEYKDSIRYFYFNQLYCAGWYFHICCDICCSITACHNQLLHTKQQGQPYSGWLRDRI